MPPQELVPYAQRVVRVMGVAALYRNIRHRLGMYITKQAEQEIYLIAQKSYAGAPPPKQIHTQLPKLWVP